MLYQSIKLNKPALLHVYHCYGKVFLAQTKVMSNLSVFHVFIKSLRAVETQY